MWKSLNFFVIFYLLLVVGIVVFGVYRSYRFVWELERVLGIIYYRLFFRSLRGV